MFKGQKALTFGKVATVPKSKNKKLESINEIHLLIIITLDN